MFLDVSGTVWHVNMTEAQRQTFSGLLRRVRQSRFRDNKKAAYTAAGVNSGTWERLEGGLTVKPTTVATVVGKLWPDTDGDWTRVPGMTVGGDTQDAEQFVESTGERVESGITNEDLLREIHRSRAEYDQLRAEVRENHRDLSERMARLEESDS